MEAFDKSFVYCNNGDLEYGNNVCYIIVFFSSYFYFQDLFVTQLWLFIFEERSRKSKERYFYLGKSNSREIGEKR